MNMHKLINGMYNRHKRIDDTHTQHKTIHQKKKTHKATEGEARARDRQESHACSGAHIARLDALDGEIQDIKNQARHQVPDQSESRS